jgi:recombination protein RecA
VAKKKDFGGGTALERLQNRLSGIKGIYVSILSESEIATINNWYDTPCYDMNRITSGSLYKGFPEKSMVVLAGPEASFKSSMACLSMAQAQRAGYTCVLIDTEGAWEQGFCRRWGLDLSKVIHLYTGWTEKVLEVVSNIQDSEEERYFIVIDSLGKIDRKKMYDDALAGDPKADQGLLQKEIKKILKMLQDIVKVQNSNVFLTAHFYGNPAGGSYGIDVETLGGGKYLRLAPDIIYSFKKLKKLDDNKQIIGSLVKGICLKNRYAPPFQEFIVDIDYKHGVDKNANMVQLALDAGVIKQGGAWFTLPDGSKVQGMGNIEVNQSMLDEIEKYIQSSGYSSVNTEVKEVYESKEKTLENIQVEGGETDNEV